MQLARYIAAAVLLATGVAHADDHAEASTQIFEERRAGDKGGLTVVHPQADFGVDIGRYTTFDAGYSADAVSGATATTYQVDAVSSATKFSDLRHQGTMALGFHGRRSSLTISGGFGTERDYLSHSIGGTASIDLPGRNTTVALSYGHSFDEVCDHDNADAMPLERHALIGAEPCNKSGGFFGKNTPGTTIWHDLSIDNAQATITQNVSPTMNLQVALWGEILNGFQSNPYRRVQVGSVSPQEHIPNERARWSLTARINRYLPAQHGAVHMGARFYDDTWRVVSGDLELGYSQYVGSSLLLDFHARVYQQTAASFFRDAFFYQTLSTAGEYYTGDRELSPVRTGMFGAKLTLITVAGDKPVWHFFDKLQFNVKGDVLLLGQIAADSTLANPMGIDKQFLYGNSLFDAVILQLGLLGNY